MTDQIQVTQVCRQGLSRVAQAKKVLVLSAKDGCSGGWVYPTREPQPCPRCQRPLTVLSLLETKA